MPHDKLLSFDLLVHEWQQPEIAIAFKLENQFGDVWFQDETITTP